MATRTITQVETAPINKYPQDYDTEALRELDELARPGDYSGCSYYERKFQIPWDEG